MQPTFQVAGIVGGVIALLLIATVVLAITLKYVNGVVPHATAKEGKP